MDRQARPSLLLGVVLLVIGGAILAVVMAADIGGTPTLEALAIWLGLAVAPLLQAIGLGLTLTGLWLVWRARQPSDN